MGDMAETLGATFAAASAPILHHPTLGDVALARGIFQRRPVMDDAGAGARLNSFEVLVTVPVADLPQPWPEQGDEVTADGERRQILAVRPDQGAMVALFLRE